MQTQNHILLKLEETYKHHPFWYSHFPDGELRIQRDSGSEKDQNSGILASVLSTSGLRVILRQSDLKEFRSP